MGNVDGHDDRVHTVWVAIASLVGAVTPAIVLVGYQVASPQARHNFWRWSLWPAFIPAAISIVLFVVLIRGWPLPGLHRGRSEAPSPIQVTAPFTPEPPLARPAPCTVATDPIDVRCAGDHLVVTSTLDSEDVTVSVDRKSDTGSVHLPWGKAPSLLSTEDKRPSALTFSPGAEETLHPLYWPPLTGLPPNPVTLRFLMSGRSAITKSYEHRENSLGVIELREAGSVWPPLSEKIRGDIDEAVIEAQIANRLLREWPDDPGKVRVILGSFLTKVKQIPAHGYLHSLVLQVETLERAIGTNEPPPIDDAWSQYLRRVTMEAKRLIGLTADRLCQARDGE